MEYTYPNSNKKLLYYWVICIVFTTMQTPFRTHTYAQTINSIETRIAKVPITSDLSAVNRKEDLLVSNEYFDGLGRPIQVVQRWGSPMGYDFVNAIEYDGYGRQARKYLPYVKWVNSGDYRVDWLNEAHSFYRSRFFSGDGVVITDYFWSEVEFGNSPLDRVIKTYAPGEAWAKESGNKPSTYRYRPNTTGTNQDNIDQFDIAINANQDISRRGLYAKDQLWVTLTTDENGNEVRTFEDKKGQVVAKKAQLSINNYATTYYLYNDFGELVFVISPEAVERARSNWNLLNDINFRKNWMFRYQYDGRGRMVEKQDPGAGTIYYVYDRRDRLVLSQDENQRSTNVDGEWAFSKYDHLNRPVISGITQLTGNRQEIQSLVNAHVDMTEDYTGSGVLFGYNNSGYPAVALSEVLTVTYYDDYNFKVDQGWPGTLDPVTNHSQLTAKGLATGSYVRILGTSELLRTVSYFDGRYRLIEVVGENHKGGTDRTKTSYHNLVHDRIEAVEMNHHIAGQSAVTITESYIYDHMDRVLEVYHQVGNNIANKVLVTSYNYNELGEVVEQSINGGTQLIDYQYNARGWLTKVNGGATAFDHASDVFGMELQYDQAGQYNGNIGSLQWKAMDNNGTGDAHQYAYNYDGANRLKTAQYTNLDNSNLNNRYTVDGPSGTIEYDRNGNIKKLRRRGINGASTTTIDDLVYTYGQGNQLTRVDDSGHPTLGFVDVTNTTDYTYDANGNMKKDRNKGITDIVYNPLNLPAQVDLSAGSVMYTYDALGTKLQQEFNGTVYDYIGPFHYVKQPGESDETLAFVQHQGGRYNFIDNRYEYDVRDHLGNNRVTISSDRTTTYTYNVGDGVGGYTDENGNPIATLNSDLIKVVGPANDHSDDVGDPNGMVLDVTGSGSSHAMVIRDIPMKAGESVMISFYSKGPVAGEVYFAGCEVQLMDIFNSENWQKFEFLSNPTNMDCVGDLKIGPLHFPNQHIWIDDITINIVSSQGEVVNSIKQRNSYYPFGMLIENATFNISNTFLATMEEDRASQEESLFQQVQETRKKFSSANHTEKGNKVARLDARHPIGPSFTLKVSKGDTLDLETFAYYEQKEPDQTKTGVAALTGVLAPVLSGGTVTVTENGLSPYAELGVTGLALPLDKYEEKAPGAYLNYLLINATGQVQYYGFKRVSEDANYHIEKLMIEEMIMEEDGYVHVFVSNEGENVKPVYFDDLSIVHRTMATAEDIAIMEQAGMSSLAVGSNRYLFQGKEWYGESGLDLYDFHARLYDPALGRFIGVDPQGQFASGYIGMGNNPVMMVDPDGELAWFVPLIIGSVVNTAVNYQNIDNFWDALGYAAVGAASGYVGGVISGADIAFSNTLAIAGASTLNSVGNYALQGGQGDIYTSFGAFSMNWTQRDFGYLGEKGNSALENIGYVLGALANLNDVNNLIDQTEATLYTQEQYADGSKDIISHTGIVDDASGEKLMSFGPNDNKIGGGGFKDQIGDIKPGGGYKKFGLAVRKGTADYPVPVGLSKSTSVTVNKYLFRGLKGFSKIVPYQGFTTNCVNMSSLGLWLNGIPNIGIHPYVLHYSMVAYNSGARPGLISYYLQK